MAQISTANLKLFIDKMARHANQWDGAAVASGVSAPGLYAEVDPLKYGLQPANAQIALLRTLVLTFADLEQTADFVAPVRDLYDGLPQVNAVRLWSGLLDALDAHAARYNAMIAGDRSPLDALLRVLNVSTPTLRAHGDFNKYFGRLSPGNVFCALPYTLATITVTGATTATFAHVAAIDATLYSTGAIALRNTKGEGLTSTTVTLTCVKSGVAQSAAFTQTHTTPDYLAAGPDADLLYSDCTGLISISGGNTGDTFSVVILPDRPINGA